MENQSNNKSLSLFSSFNQVRELMNEIAQAEETGQMMLVDQLVSDFYKLLKESEGGIDRCIGYVKFAEKDVDAIDEEIKRLQDLKKSRERSIERIKQLALAYMDTIGSKSLEGSLGRKFYKVETSSVVITGLDHLPDSYKRITTVVEPHKQQIAADIKTLGHVPGATLVYKSHIRIK